MRSVAVHPSPTAAGNQSAEVRYVDVDGDGRSDRVVVQWSHERSAITHAGSRLISVHLADGRTLRRPAPSEGFAGPIGGDVGWVRAIQLPGVVGHQIALFVDTGAANQFYVVLADVHGELVALRSPGPDASRWNSGGSDGTGSGGVYCHAGVLYSSYSTFERGNGIPLKHPHLRVAGYVWRNGRWARVAHYVGPDNRYDGSTASTQAPFSGC